MVLCDVGVYPVQHPVCSAQLAHPQSGALRPATYPLWLV